MDRLVLNEIVGLFFGGVALFTTLFFATGELLRYVEFLQSGEGWALVIKLILMTLPMALSYTAAMGMLLACLLGFGRLSDDAELTAITAAGVSFPRVMAPVVAFGLLVSGGLAIGAHTLIPNTMRSRQALLDGAKNKLGGGPQVREAIFLPLPYQGGTLLLTALSGVGTETDGVATLRDVTIAVEKAGVTSLFVHAAKARWRLDTKDWRLEGVERLARWDGENLLTYSGEELTTREVAFALKPPDQLNVFDRPEMERTSADLRIRAALLHEAGQPKDARKAEGEIARRDSTSLAPLIFALVGAPLGVRPKRGGSGIGYALSVLITFVYWMASQLSLSLGIGGALPPSIAGQLPNLLGIGLGIVFIRRVMRYNKV